MGSLFLIPAAVVPIAVVIFFWEMNIPRNIPLYQVLKIFLISGLCTGIVFVIIKLFINNDNIPQDNFLHWLLVGIVEELTKLIIIIVVIRKTEYCWGLNGLLIGAAVGCGFAVFETVGYAFDAIIRYSSFTAGLDALTVRGILAIDGHVIWAAMYGGALALSKGKQKLEAKHFGNPAFLISFFAAVLLHGLFDYYPIFVNLFKESNPDLYTFLNVQNVDSSELVINWLPAILMSIIFAIPTYAIILWLLRKSVRQVVVYSSGAGKPRHADQVKPSGNAAPNFNGAGSSSGGSVLVLECVSGELSGQSYTVNPGITFTIGRSHQCNIQFSDSAKGISRSHCSVSFSGGKAVVTDLGSSHGTFFKNGQRFQPQMSNPLGNGDTFYLASPKNTFRVVIK